MQKKQKNNDIEANQRCPLRNYNQMEPGIRALHCDISHEMLEEE